MCFNSQKVYKQADLTHALEDRMATPFGKWVGGRGQGVGRIAGGSQELGKFHFFPWPLLMQVCPPVLTHWGAHFWWCLFLSIFI